MLLDYCKKLVAMFREGDPVFNCEVYLTEGCSHVDGYLCDFDTCSTRLEALTEESFSSPQADNKGKISSPLSPEE